MKGVKDTWNQKPGNRLPNGGCPHRALGPAPGPGASPELLASPGRALRARVEPPRARRSRLAPLQPRGLLYWGRHSSIFKLFILSLLLQE